MCGRFAFKNVQLLLEELGVDAPPDFGKLGPEFAELSLSDRYNIAPTQPVIAIAIREGKKQAGFYQWGLVPSWASDPSIGQKLINARGETLAEKPSFRGAYKYHRCVIPASGFYEWKGARGSKQPCYIERKDGQPLAFAGLYEIWERGEGYLETVSIVTTEANDLLSELHHRMPVILDQGNVDRWIDPRTPGSPQLDALIRPYPSENMRFYPVSPAVGNVQNDGPELIVPVGSNSLFD